MAHIVWQAQCHRFGKTDPKYEQCANHEVDGRGKWWIRRIGVMVNVREVYPMHRKWKLLWQCTLATLAWSKAQMAERLHAISSMASAFRCI